MRQSAQQAEPSSAWKQEVNRRVAQHQGRKGKAASSKMTSADGLTIEGPTGKAAGRPSTRAAARVAERYAKAPSYSEMIAREALAAIRGVQAASTAELVAQSTEVALPELEAASVADSAPSYTASCTTSTQAAEPELPMVAEPEQARPRTHQPPVFKRAIELPPAKPAASERPFEIRWDADLPVREAALTYARASREDAIYEVDADAVSKYRLGEREVFDLSELEMVEPAQPIYANLIHFPRELVAAHKARPRRAEGPIATLDEVQLSIFEAKLETVNAAPAAAKAAGSAAPPTWAGMDLPAIKLDDEPKPDTLRSSPSSTRVQGPEPVQQLGAHVAPLNRRILAGIVDFSLVTGAFLTGALVGTLNATVLPPLKEMEIGSLVALALIAVFYQALFFGLSRATPGMQYAGLELRTFAGKRPRLAQRFVRAAAMIVSLLPLGLGAAWALFDDQQLSWHDRLSSTYLRKA